MNNMFVLSIKKRGTPTYATYSSMQQEQLGLSSKQKVKINNVCIDSLIYQSSI